MAGADAVVVINETMARRYWPNESPIGATGAFWASRFLSQFLFGVKPSDPATYGVVASLILIVCCAASYAPARRITTVNPVEVLRAD